MKTSFVLYPSVACFLVLLLFPAAALTAVDLGAPGTNREYSLAISDPTDMDLVARTGVSAYKLLADAYLLCLDNLVPKPIRPFTTAAWLFSSSYLATIWPHEFGHRARARQIGGDFVIEGFAVPWPKARMVLPTGRTLYEETLASVGGFEINGLMRLQIVSAFFRNGYAYSEELIHSFIQEIYYPMYAFLIAPGVGSVDPESPGTWIDTVGDPVESSLLVYRSYTGRPAVRQDNTVDPELVSYYRECTFASVLWMLLDPLLYQGVLSFGADRESGSGRIAPWMIGNDSFAWMYSTLFNPSPLGYELHLYNYIRVNGKLFVVRLRYGRPYLNIGIGAEIPELWGMGRFDFGARAEYWLQDVYGQGVLLSGRAGFSPNDAWRLSVDAGWKQRGYLLGAPLGETPMLRLLVDYRF